MRYLFAYNTMIPRKEIKLVAKKLIRLGYSYIGTIYDDDFIYDIYENDRGIKKLVIIGVR